MTFKTKFKLDQEVVWQGLRYVISSLRLYVEPDFKSLYYELMTTSHADPDPIFTSVEEKELLKENPQVAR